MGGDKGKGKSKGEKDKGDKGKSKSRNDELTVVVKGLSFNVEEAVLRKDFEECGEVERLSLPKNEEGKVKGIAFIQFKSSDAIEKALKYDSQEYGGRTIYVSKAGEGGKGDKEGKDGKGKGKGGKSKGKDGKGKKR